MVHLYTEGLLRGCVHLRRVFVLGAKANAVAQHGMLFGALVGGVGALLGALVGVLFGALVGGVGALVGVLLGLAGLPAGLGVGA